MRHDNAPTGAPLGAGAPWKLPACLATVLLLGGCTTPSWYLQSVTGHLRLWHAQRDLDAALADERMAPALRTRLGDVPALLEFARVELALPDNGSYRTFVQLDRPYVAWNVFAAPPLSLDAHRWCYPVAGCVSYRGYFAETAARAEAARLAAHGNDVFVGGVTAYSTLGWFRDPVTSAMLRGDRLDLAALLFHELAHQKLWLAGDTDLNEAFAETVARIGVERLAERDGPAAVAGWHARTAAADHFHALVLAHRDVLARIYTSDRTPTEKLQAKARQLERLKDEYRRNAGGHADAALQDWLERDLNNAKLAALSSYRALVPELLDLFALSRRDLVTFYDRMERLASCGPADRRAWLRAGTPGESCAGAAAKAGNHE